MQKWYLIMPFALVLLASVRSAGLASSQPNCARSDSTCLKLQELMDAEQYDEIIAKIDPHKNYSRESKGHIGQAYLMIAGREENTPEQEELYCRKALEYGATPAYMGLYFITAEKDPEAALGYLRRYIETKPSDSVPYVILGEAELTKMNYALACEYFVEARKVSHGRSANLDWLLFQASYLAGDFTTATSMLDSALSQGKTEGDLQALVAADRRFSEIGGRKEFRKFFPSGSGATNANSFSRS